VNILLHLIKQPRVYLLIVSLFFLSSTAAGQVSVVIATAGSNGSEIIVKDKFIVGETINLRVDMTNLGGSQVYVPKGLGFSRPILFRDGEPVPYRTEAAAQFNKGPGGVVIGLLNPKPNETQTDVIYLEDFYEPLEPGHYQIHLERRFFKTASVLSNVLLFEVLSSGTYSLQGDAPRVLKYTLPDYPIPPVHLGIEETLKARIQINENGEVRSVKADAKFTIFNKVVEASVSSWKFERSSVKDREFDLTFIFRLLPSDSYDSFESGFINRNTVEIIAKRPHIEDTVSYNKRDVAPRVTISTAGGLGAADVSSRQLFAQADYDSILKKADLVTTAEVVEVYASPGFWSGVAPALQKVKYKIVKTLKGSTDRTEIIVAHYVVKNSKTADSNGPGLSPVLFLKGNTLMLFLKANPQGNDQSIDCQYLAWSENYGAVITSRKIEKAIRKTVRNQTH
jgi:hypothetical protein